MELITTTLYYRFLNKARASGTLGLSGTCVSVPDRRLEVTWPTWVVLFLCTRGGGFNFHLALSRCFSLSVDLLPEVGEPRNGRLGRQRSFLHRVELRALLELVGLLASLSLLFLLLDLLANPDLGQLLDEFTLG